MKIFTAALFTLLLVAPASAAERTIRVTGRAHITVTTDEVRLGDIAEIQSDRIEDDEAVIGLKKIWVQKSPQPATDVTLSANEVLSTVAGQGVDLESIAYTFPRIMSVKRAGRIIAKSEIQAAIENYLQTTKSDATIQSIDYADNKGVPPGQITLAVDSLAAFNPGKRAAQLIASIDGTEAARFSVLVNMDEYRQIPVAKRNIAKGAMVSDSDIYLARFNTALLPTDAIENAGSLIGMEATNAISSGEVFRNAKLSMPKVIEAGAKVTMQYKTEVFEATASGIALESGAVGQEIKIRNDASKKIISGIVAEQGLVRVK